MAQQLLDFSIPLNINLLDATVSQFYGTGSNEEVNFLFYALALVILPARLK